MRVLREPVVSEASNESADLDPVVVFRQSFRVEYIDTDAMAVVHHASYWRWLERARVEWMRAQGMTYLELERQGWGLPLSSAEIRYLRPLVFDDEGLIELTIRQLGQSDVTLGYRLYKIMADSKKLVTEAATHHVACRRKETEKGVRWIPARLPEEWRNLWLSQSAPKPSTSR